MPLGLLSGGPPAPGSAAGARDARGTAGRKHQASARERIGTGSAFASAGGTRLGH
jgi:hypothetical protein